MATSQPYTDTPPKTPYVAQDIQEVAALYRALEDSRKKNKGNGNHSHVHCKKTPFKIAGSKDGIFVESWRFHDWDYKRQDLPTYARGLFTTRTRNNAPEIAIRGYDKFFNTGEVDATKWENIEKQTRGPYELTLKENGCIIFISGLEDDTLLICSKHSTGERSDVEVSHAVAGERHVEKQLAAMGKTKTDLARDLRARNVTAVAELCDDDFEEHILAYGPDKAGLYLHGINLNVPTFTTYPSALVQKFAEEWSFKQIGLITMHDVKEVKVFLDGVAESGAHDGRDIEGFVIRCQRSIQPESAPWEDWFFKYKFEEPYLLYRQWRECTKQMISGKTPKYNKHTAITGEYLAYARQRLIANPKLGKAYNMNHGIIALRDDFLAFKNINGVDAAALEAAFGTGSVATEVTKDIILVPIATIGCGKTTIAVALTRLFGFGHVQNDNISGAKRPPRFTKMVLDELQEHNAVVADRNNAQKHERKQILTDAKMGNVNARLVALYFKHDNVPKIRGITQDRVLARGDNHQTIQAATDPAKVRGIMEGFISRFEPLNPTAPPDDAFDQVIELDPTQDSRVNLETVISELRRLYPNLIKTMPTDKEMDDAIAEALGEYRPDMRHTIPDRGGNNKKNNGYKESKTSQPQQQKIAKKKPLEYVAVDVPAKTVNDLLEKAFGGAGQDADKTRFYKQLKGTRRVQPKFHVTLMHRASAKDQSELWDSYLRMEREADAKDGPGGGAFGQCQVVLERVVFDTRIMAIVVRLVDPGGSFKCSNKIPHVTIGTRDDGVKPKESNDLLAKWLDEGCTEQNKIVDVVLDGRPTVEGVVRGVLSR